MGKADIYESDYLENEEIFADLVNGVLYQGKQIVKPQELSEQDGELRSISMNQTKKIIRDKAKMWRGTAFVVFSLENQTKVDYRMVFRAMLSESMAYDKQLKKRKEEWKKKENQSSEEFISGMGKEDKFIPIITIVIYYGKEKQWDGARTLYELLDTKGNGEIILPYISNYRLNVFDYHEYDDFGQFHSELQSVFEFLRYAGDKRLLGEKLKKNEEKYRKLSSQAKALLAHLTNIKKLPDVKSEDIEKGEFDMCKAFEDMKEEGRIEGKAEAIIEMGYEFKLSEGSILEKLRRKLDISAEEAQRLFAIFNKKAVL